MNVFDMINHYENPYDFDKLIIGDKYRMPLNVKQYTFFLDYINKNYSDNKVKILDIGAYLGLFVDLVRKNFNNFDIVGIENYEPFVILAKSKNIPVELCDVNHIDLCFKENSFDIVIAQNFFHKELKELKFKSKLEYFTFIDNVLMNVSYVLKPGAIFLFNTETYMELEWFKRNAMTLVFSKKNNDSRYICFRKNQSSS